MFVCFLAWSSYNGGDYRWFQFGRISLQRRSRFQVSSGRVWQRRRQQRQKGKKWSEFQFGQKQAERSAGELVNSKRNCNRIKVSQERDQANIRWLANLQDETTSRAPLVASKLPEPIGTDRKARSFFIYKLSRISLWDIHAIPQTCWLRDTWPGKGKLARWTSGANCVATATSCLQSPSASSSPSCSCSYKSRLLVKTLLAMLNFCWQTQKCNRPNEERAPR